MQIYALKIHNFFRFGEKNNTIVFDISEEEKAQLQNKEITIDEIYEKVMADPIAHVNKVKKRGLERMIGIAGMFDGNVDFSNGSGKSSILESITYLHYDKVIRKLVNTDKSGKAGVSVVTKIDGKYPATLKESYVEELFEENGSLYRAKRGNSFTKTQKSHSPILEFECIKDGGNETANSHRKGDTAKTLEDVNANDYDVFVSTQMFGQNDSGKFLNGTDKIKKEMLISLLKLQNVVDGCLEETRNRKNKQDKKVEQIRSALDVMENNLKKSCSVEIIDEKTHENTLIRLNDKVKNNRDAIEQNEVLLKEKDKEILTLQSSDLISLATNLYNDGVRVKNEKLAIEKQAEEQTKEWKKLEDEAQQDYEKMNKKYNDDISSIQKIKLNINTLKKEIESYNETAYTELKAKIEKARKVKPEYEGKKKEAEKNRDSILSEVAVSKSKILAITEEITQLKKQLTTDSDSFVCKYCKQEVSVDHIKDEIKKNENTQNELSLDFSKLNVKKDEINSELKIIDERLNKIEAIIGQERNNDVKKIENDNKKKKISDLEIDVIEKEKNVNLQKIDIDAKLEKKSQHSAKIVEISDKFKVQVEEISTKLKEIGEKYKKAKEGSEPIQAKIEVIKKEKETLGKDNEKLHTEIGSFNTIIKNVNSQFEQYLKEKNVLKDEISELNRYLVLDDVFGLDGIQTRIITRYLPLLNTYIKEFMDVLTDGEMSIRLWINDRKEVALTIKGGSADNYDMLSGGEKMICRLGVDIALALLSFSRLSKTPEMICLDEIFGPLDNFHTETVFKVLEKLKKKFERVIIISHKASIQNLIQTSIMVERNSGINGLSSIVRIGDTEIK